jgi:hypothetical protein
MTGSPGNNAFTFIGNAAFTAEGQIRFVQTGTSTILQINTAGTDVAEMEIKLVSFTGTDLGQEDFVL